MWIVANIPPQTLARAAVPLYVLGVLLLIGVALVRRRRQRLAALAQPGLRAHPAVRAHEDRAAADARVVLPEIRGPDQLEGFRGRGGTDRRAGLPHQAPARPGHGVADRRVGLLRALPGRPVVEGHRRAGRAGGRRRAPTSGRTCTTTSASASSRSSIRRAIRSAPATTRRRRRSRSAPAASSARAG